MRNPWTTTPSHEDVFLDHYDHLLKAALHLTGNDRPRAEDILHTAYVQFTLARPDLSEIRDIGGYLYICLRNTHISQVRRRATIAAAEVSVADYDFAEASLEAAPTAELLDVEDQLWTICGWACSRKENAKSASVLILRFFLGYSTREVAMILHGSTSAAEKLVQTGRREVRVVLGHRDDSSEGNEPYPRRPAAHGAFLGRVRQRISDSCSTPCWSEDDLLAHYRSGKDSVPCSLLAHLASCNVCLQKVCGRLGIQSNGNHPSDGSSGLTLVGKNRKTPSRRDFRERVHRIRQRTLDHMPREICVAVNGFLVGCQTVEGANNKLTLRLPAHERVDFVEVHSEQGVHLLLLNVELPPEGPLRQHVEVPLGDGPAADRSLAAEIDFTSQTPRLQVTYCAASGELAYTSAASSAPSHSQGPSKQESDSDHGWRELLRMLPWSRPLAFGGLIAVLLSAVLLFVQVRGLSAAALLARSAQNEIAVTGAATQVVHRTIRFEERTGAVVVARRRVELWKSPESNQRAIRVYDSEGNLMAGEWTSDGQRTIHPSNGSSSPEKQPTDLGEIAGLPTDELARFEPTATFFRTLLGDRLKDAKVDAGFGATEIHWEGHAQAASIKLDQHNNLRPVELRFVLNPPEGLRTVQYVETAYEVVRADSIPDGIFTPEAGSASAPALVDRQPTAAGRDSQEPSERQVLRILAGLDKAGVLMNENLDLQALPGQSIHASLLVEDEARKAEIIRTMEAEVESSSFDLTITTYREVAERAAQNRAPQHVVSRTLTVSEEPSEDEERLRRHLASRELSPQQIVDELARIGDESQKASREMRQHIRAAGEILRRFPPDQVRALGAPEQQLWSDMLRTHLRAARSGAAALHSVLADPFLSPVRSPVASQADVGQAATRLAELVARIDQTTLLAFSVVASPQQRPSLGHENFWRDVEEATELTQFLEESLPFP